MKTQGTISVVTGLIGFTTFTCLLIDSKIGTLAYSSLLGLLAIVCLVIPVLERLRELDLKNLKLTLEKIEEAKKEIYAKEDSLKESSFVLSELIAATSTLSGLIGDKESESYSKSLINAKLKKLAQQLKFNSTEMGQIFKYERALSELQTETASKEDRQARWNSFKQFLKSEAEKSV